MKFVPTAVSGAFVVEVDARPDERGLFARTFDAKSFADHGLVPVYPQCKVSHNHKRGTFRGMH